MGAVIDIRRRFLDNDSAAYVVDSFAVQIYVSKIMGGVKVAELPMTLPRGFHPADLGPAFAQAVAQAKAQDEAAGGA